MTIQHKDLPEAQLHEPKGVSTALQRQVYRSDGAGSGAWEYVMADVTISPALVARSFLDQNPTAVDTPIQVEFGAAQSNPDISVDSSGTVTFSTAGSYFMSFFGRLGRTTSAGSAYLGIRFLKNGVQQGATAVERLPDGDITSAFAITLLVEAQAADTLEFELVRDSAGINNGGLQAFTTTLGTWEDAPSASLFLYKLEADDS